MKAAAFWPPFLFEAFGTMRNTTDRIRHAISFEIIAIMIATPVSALLFKQNMTDMGVITVGSATIAMVFNYAYNWVFDHAMLRFRGTVRKTIPIRIFHAILFELGLLFVLTPFIAFYLGVGLWTALMMDLALTVFYLVYAFSFNWIYDAVFPVSDAPKQGT
ncbi:PACE efflux transporter [Marivivens sp. LCG002]|uniref:PACE efflux transporter n=1 Tax=Marivivens sp. LCG002 TaxID=3051171 RepID=UPI0033301669